ncbi:MAG: DUF167 domain-containing protein [Methanoregulaceae archaeon]|jgi:hypothetical protein|nr:DUF167 domain-containing protein [Methanoregulaceae archaeon]
MADISDALAASSHGTIVTIEVTTGCKSDSFPAGYNPWRKAVGCQISAQPISGKANIAIIGLVASVLNISKSDISIVTGTTSSHKKILVRGISTYEVKLKLETLIPG